MKLQRYEVCNGFFLQGYHPDESGSWCKSADVAELEAENKRLHTKLARYENDGTTHAADCWSWGPKHYECALAEIERLKALERNKWMIYGKLVGPLTPPEV